MSDLNNQINMSDISTILEQVQTAHADGRINSEQYSNIIICKINELRTTSNGKKNLHFILANNIFTNNGQKINNYLPVTCWGNLAQQVSEMNVNDKITIRGELHSRTYHKLNIDNEKEYNVTYELLMTNLEKLQ